VLVRDRAVRVAWCQHRHRRPARRARWLRILVAGWPAVAFLGGTLLAHSATGSASTPSPEPTTTEPAAVLAPARPAPAIPAVPAALVAHARKVAADHLTRTGNAIDTPTLRARLGVPAQLAEAITAQL
jgi:hypothetical protein